jgi:Mor family transcriptional regulator
MKTFTLLQMCQDLMILAQRHGLSVHDVKYIPMFQDFKNMRIKNGQKYEYAIETLSKKYHLSTSQIKRLVKKYDTTVADL